MFSKYTILFAILALFAAQGAQALYIESADERALADERSLADLVDKAKQAIERLRQTIHNAVDSAKHRLGDVKDAIIAEAEKALAKAEEAIQTEVDKVRDQIKKIKHEAELLGVDVKECVAENQDELQQIPRNIIDKLIKCVTDQIAEAKAIIEGAINDIIRLKDDMESFPEDLKICMKHVSMKCVRSLIAAIVNSISSTPSNIQNSVNQIVQLVTNLEANLKACAATKIMEASKEAAVVGGKVAKCVAEKIMA